MREDLDKEASYCLTSCFILGKKNETCTKEKLEKI